MTTRSHLSKSVTDALDALKEKGLVDVVEKFGGAGYKVRSLRALISYWRLMVFDSGTKGARGQCCVCVRQSWLQEMGYLRRWGRFSCSWWVSWRSYSSSYYGLHSGGHLTDISGRLLCYESTVQRNNTGGVLASAPWVNHQVSPLLKSKKASAANEFFQEYISSIPKALKDQLPEIAAKS